jgi:hypothetical protein
VLSAASWLQLFLPAVMRVTQGFSVSSKRHYVGSHTLHTFAPIFIFSFNETGSQICRFVFEECIKWMHNVSLLVVWFLLSRRLQKDF